MIAGFLSDVGNFFLAVFIRIMMLFLKLVRLLLDLVFDIANIEFIKQPEIDEILKRVYIIIGILMLFKIVISCIQYLVNPDKLEDKEAGFGAIIKRALIAMALLAFVPTIFKVAKTAQTAIVEALPKIILGAENVSSVENISDKLTFTTALTFFGYNTEYNVSETDDVCNDGSIAGLGKSQGSPMFSTINDIYNNAEVIVESTCNPHKGKRYEVNYLIGFASSIYLTILLASMLLDVGVRVVKFSFLEMIAPVPIASYIDPKTSKKSFDSWVHNCLMVYVDLFIRIGVIFLVLHLFVMLLPKFISNFTLVDGTPLSWGRSRIINIILVIGMFMFAKNAPKFICDVLGIKGDGSIGDMFKRVGSYAGLGAAAYRAARSNFTAQTERWKGKGKGPVASRLRAAFSAAAGATSATARGLKMAVWDKKGYNDIRRGASKAAVDARDARTDRADNLYEKDENGKTLYGWRKYREDKRRADLGIPSSSGFLEARNKNASDIRSSVDSSVSHGLKKLEDYQGDIFTSSSANGFGSYTNSDGETIVVNSTSYAHARKMASLNNGDYYDDGKAQERQLIFKQKNDDVTALEQKLNNMKNSPFASSNKTEIANMEIELQKARDDRDEYQVKFFNEGQNGRAIANETMTAQWSAIVHNFEKQARFQVESNLLATADVDAVTQLQKTIGMLKSNSTLGKGKDPMNKAIVEIIQKSMGVDSSGNPICKSIDDVIKLLDKKNDKGGYDVSAEVLANVKKMSEDLVRITNEEALTAAERTKRTQKAIQNDKKGS